MSSISNVTHTHLFKSEGCCHVGKTKFDLALRSIEKISAIALGVFSAYKSMKLFIPFFFVGIAIGLYNFAKDKRECGYTQPVSSCSQSFLENLTGVKQPPVISLAANIAVTVCHIDHHQSVFVPIIGLTLGTWLGKSLSDCGDLSFKKIKAHLLQQSKEIINHIMY